MEVHRGSGNTHTLLFLSEKLPIVCHPFFPVYEIYEPTGGPLLLPPEN